MRLGARRLTTLYERVPSLECVWGARARCACCILLRSPFESATRWARDNAPSRFASAQGSPSYFTGAPGLSPGKVKCQSQAGCSDTSPYPNAVPWRVFTSVIAPLRCTCLRLELGSRHGQLSNQLQHARGLIVESAAPRQLQALQQHR